MAFYDKFVRRTDFNFSLAASYFITWFAALSQTTFSIHVLGRLLFSYLLWAVVIMSLLAILEKSRGRAIFGNRQLAYYPWGTAVVISVVLSLLIGISYAFTGDTTLTPLRLSTLVVGFLGGVAVIMWYLHTLVSR